MRARDTPPVFSVYPDNVTFLGGRTFGGRDIPRREPVWSGYDAGRPVPLPGLRFSAILVDPARFQELFDTKVLPDAAFLRETCFLYDVLPAGHPLAAVLADDPRVYAVVEGKDEFGSPALEAFTCDAGVVSHYRVSEDRRQAIAQGGEASLEGLMPALHRLQAKWDAEALAQQEAEELAAQVARATPGLDRLCWFLTAAITALGLWLLVFNGTRWWFGA